MFERPATKFSSLTGESINPRTLIAETGFKSWPKLFQNLRSTHEMELAERWPEHVVCAWIGNSRAVARKNYLQVTEEHFEQAARIVDNSNDEKEKAAQNTAQ